MKNATDIEVNTKELIFQREAARLLSSCAQAFLRAGKLYLPERRVLSLAGGARGRVVGIVEGLVAGVHGDLVLPIEAVVAQLGHPLIEQFLRFNLQRQSDRNQEEDESTNKRGQGEETHVHSHTHAHTRTNTAILLLFKSFQRRRVSEDN